MTVLSPINTVRPSMRYLPTIFTALVLTGCSDVVTTRFAALEDATSQRAFERGWLPPVLPDSAKCIVESDDMDANTGTGSFDYDVSERAGYVDRLARSGASLQTEADADVVTLTTNGARWDIRLPRHSGEGRWSVRLL